MTRTFDVVVRDKFNGVKLASIIIESGNAIGVLLKAKLRLKNEQDFIYNKRKHNMTLTEISTFVDSKSVIKYNEENFEMDFRWGPIKKIHEIGEYKILEYHPEIFKDCCGTDNYDMKKTTFHVYINDESTIYSYTTLDKALIGAIARKHDGVNTKANLYFEKMVGIYNEINTIEIG